MQIIWGIKMCYLRRKYDHVRDLLLKFKLLPAELFINQRSLTRMFVVEKNIMKMQLVGSSSITKYL